MRYSRSAIETVLNHADHGWPGLEETIKRILDEPATADEAALRLQHALDRSSTTFRPMPLHHP